MAGERKISTRLVLEGEREYRAAISSVNQEYKLLQSQIKLVDSQFAGQKNSIAALEAKNKALNASIANQTEKFKLETDAIKNNKSIQDEASKKAEEAKAKLDALQASTDKATKGTQEYKDKVAALEKEYNGNVAASEKAAAAVDKHTINANNAQIKINQLNGELKNNKKYLDEAKNSADGCATSIDEFGKETKQTADESKELGEKGKQGINAIASALAAAGIAKTYQEIADALKACADASIDFESALAGVSKTTNLSGEKLKAMGGEIKSISLEIPITASEFAKIAEIGAQLGISNDKLIDFSKVMANLGVATNLTSEQAATLLAQFANVTRMDAGQYSNLGSAIVALGNNFATSESNIVEMSQRLAASGTLAGLTEPQILALATAMSSVGIQAEAGGTAMTQTLTEIEKAVANGGDSLNQFAKIAGISASEFTTTWQTDPMTALQNFIKGLGDLDSAGESSTLVLEEMGLSGIRQSGTLKSLSLASDQLTKATTLANTAWKENTALTREAETRYATTDSKIKLFKNSVTALQISIGDQLTPALGELYDTGADVVQWAADFVEQNEWLAPAITGVVAALGALSLSVVAVTVVVPALKAAWAALQGVMGPIGWISLAVGAVVALGTAIASATSKGKENIDGLSASASALPETLIAAQEEYQKNLDEIEAKKEKADALLGTLSYLESKASAGNLDASEWKEWNDTLSMLVETVPELSQYINLQTGEIEGGVAALKKYNEALDTMARQEAAVKALSDQYLAQANAHVKLTTAQKNLTTAQEKQSAIQTQITNKENALAQALGISVEQLNSVSGGWDAAALSAYGADASVETMVAELDSLKRQGEESQKSVDNLTQSQNDAQKAYDDSTKSLEDQRAALYAIDEEQKNASNGADNLTQSQTNAVTKFNDLKMQLDALTTAYTDTYNNALQSINGIVNGFNAITMPDPKDINDLITALNSQNIYLDNYAGNLVKLEEIASSQGVSDSEAYQTLVSMLSDGSIESAANLQAIVNDGGDNLQMLLTQVSEISKGKETFSSIVANMQTDFKDKSAAIQAEMKTLADNLNQSTAAGDSVRATMDAVTAQLAAGASTIESIVSRINTAIASIGMITYTEEATGYNTGTTGANSHAAGLSYVPYDDYFARLHEGEMVLTELQAKAYRAEQNANYNYSIVEIPTQTPVVNVPSIDYERLGTSVANAMIGFGIDLDGERVATLQANRIGQIIDEDMQRGRYS